MCFFYFLNLPLKILNFPIADHQEIQVREQDCELFDQGNNDGKRGDKV